MVKKCGIIRRFFGMCPKRRGMGRASLAMRNAKESLRRARRLAAKIGTEDEGRYTLEALREALSDFFGDMLEEYPEHPHSQDVAKVLDAFNATPRSNWMFRDRLTEALEKAHEWFDSTGVIVDDE